nr:hypothetical protein [Tanacetum cinerariifolium]
MIIADAVNRPPMLEKSMYDSWKSRMELYIENRKNMRMILNSILNGPLVWPTIVEENGLPPDVYAIINHRKVAKEIWDIVKLLMQGMKLSLQEKECKLYDEFNKFSFVKGETLYKYYWRFSQLTNNMNIINMLMRPVQVNTKFLNSLPPEWIKFVTDVKLPIDLNTTNFDNNMRHMQMKLAYCSKRPRNAAWFKEKAILAEVREVGKILDEEQLAFLTDLGIPDVLMANLSNYGLDVISEDKANQEKNNKSLTAELKRYKERDKTCEQRLNIDLSIREKMIDSQMDDMIKEKLALKQQIDSLEQNLSNQIKEKEYLLQTFTVFKSESKEKESKYIDKEIDLEKKIKELDNIVYKVGQSAQTVHMLTKPQIFYDTHKQALGYQNPFYLKKAQRIKPTLYDSSVISSQYVASPVIDDEENLILEE